MSGWNATEVLRAARTTIRPMASITVVGAGVSGLSTALVLARGGHEVTVVARDGPEATVSAVAGAAWYPLRAERDDRTDAWLRESYRTLMSFVGRVPGVVARTVLESFRSEPDETWWRDVLPGFRPVEPRPGFAAAWIAEPVPVIDMEAYLPWLVRAVRTHGSIQRVDVRALTDLPGDVIVNCSGLGASHLAPDEGVYPIRGQVTRVEQVGLRTMLLDEENPAGVAYVIPRARDIVLGGVRDRHDHSPDWDQRQAEAIRARCIDLEPRLASARVVSRAVGFRPGREGGVRLAAEEHDGRLIVHNYGHGGSGVTLSWGCARDVRALVESLT